MSTCPTVFRNHSCMLVSVLCCLSAPAGAQDRRPDDRPRPGGGTIATKEDYAELGYTRFALSHAALRTDPATPSTRVALVDSGYCEIEMTSFIWIVDLRSRSVLAQLPLTPDYACCRVASIGDLDADGIGDFAVLSDPKSDHNVAEVRSGADGKTILKLGTTMSAAPIRSISCIPDTNLDDHIDVLVGQPEVDNGSGAAFIISGVDGTIIRKLSPPVGVSNFASTIQVVRSTSTKSMHLVSIARGDKGFPCLIISGMEKSNVIATLPFSENSSHYRPVVGTTQDLDGDAWQDLFVGCGDFVAVVSGLTGKTIWQTTGDWKEAFGSAVTVLRSSAVLGINEQGSCLVAYSSPNFGVGEGYVCVASMKADDKKTRVSRFLDEQWHFGFALSTISDLDLDGTEDYLVGVDNRLSRAPGILLVVSGKSGRALLSIQRVGSGVRFIE